MTGRGDAQITSGLRIELLGHFRLMYDGQPVVEIHGRQKALLTYLILNRRRPQSRQHLASLFWPDSGDSQALTNLRRELHTLRRTLPHADRFLVMESGMLRWGTEAAFTCDVCEFEAAIERGGLDGLREAMQLYQGALLPDCYEDWIAPERERLRAMVVDGLKRLMTTLEEQRAYSETLQHARRLMALEPLDEGVYRSLMRLHALQGERAAALRAYHICATTLERELGVAPDAETRAVYERLVDAQEQPKGPPAASMLPLVGREREWAVLLSTWRAAAEGKPQMALVQGEAGIGKTRLAEELVEWCTRQGIATARTRSYPAVAGLAYAPVADWLRSDAVKHALGRLEVPWLVELARLMPELTTEHPSLPSPEPLTESWQRQRFLEALARAVLTAPQPLLLVLEDLQWCDRDTLEWLHYLLRAHRDAKLLVVGTLRAEEASDNPALSPLLLHLRQVERLVEIDLGPLNETDTACLAAHVAGHTLDPRAVTHLFRQTEGHPLFVVEMTRAGPDGPLSLPPKVQAVIAARLSGLSQPARDLVQLAACVGRDFSVDVLGEASDLDEKALITALDELWQRRIVREHGARGYDFSHDRVREVAYLEIRPASRRVLHKRVAQALELIHASDLDPASLQLATHYEQAGQTAKALQFYRRAAEVARRVFANEEVIRSLSKALALLRALPETLERDREELALQLARSGALTAATGWTSPELEATLERVRDLGSLLQEPEAVVLALGRLTSTYFVRANIPRSLEAAEHVLQLAAGRPALLSDAHHIVAGSLYMLGDLGRACDHFEQAIALYDPHQSQSLHYELDVLVLSMSQEAHALWQRGYPDRAAARSRHAIARAEKLQHPHNLAYAHAYAALTHQLRRERHASEAHAQRAVELCARYGFAYYGDWGKIICGLWLAETSPEVGIAMIRHGLASLRALGSEVRRPYYLSLLTGALIRTGLAGEAHGALDDALATAARNGESWWNAELYRLKGELSESSENWFERAIETAQSQGSKSLELRAAVSLACLWKKQGEGKHARAHLAPVYEWFTEGLDTADLTEARTVLAEM